jgi:hypothetical protein
MARTAHMAFIGRSHLLERVRTLLRAGQHIALLGESGIGKTALARRLEADAIYLEHVAPAKEMLGALLMECYRRGWYCPGGESDEEVEEPQAEKMIRRLDLKAATDEALRALRGQSAVLVLDNFERASPSVVNICRRLQAGSTLVVVAPNVKEAHRAFLFAFEKIEVPRLTPCEAGQLVDRLLGEYSQQIEPREVAALRRHILEQAQGVPAVAHELVTRARRRGEISLREVRKEADLHAHRTVDMTPALLVMACLFIGMRVALRGLHDADLTALMGGSGALFMLVRVFAFRLSRHRR